VCDQANVPNLLGEHVLLVVTTNRNIFFINPLILYMHLDYNLFSLGSQVQVHLSDFLQSSEGDGDVIVVKDEVVDLDIDEGEDYGQSHWSETSSGVSSGLVEESTSGSTSGESSPAQTEASAGQPLGDLEARTYNKESASKTLRFQEKNSYSI
jgi:hypothetical protein